MPIDRKRKASRQMWRKKKSRATTNKPIRLTRITNVRKDLHFFTRSFAQGVINGNALHTPWTGAYAFSLNQLPGLTDFTTLFDRYMISHVQLRFYLKQDPSAQTATGSIYPKLYTVKDYDDNSAPVSIDDLRQHSKCRVSVLHPNRPVIVNLKPAVLGQVYRSPTTVTYTPQWRRWIDMAQTDVPHYGIKAGLDDLSNTNYQVLIEGKLWFACKDQR